jgi:hypothetical protein
LEPWILLQMPFHPVILHQWAATLLAEALIFQQKISPIFCYGFSKEIASIAFDLRKMLLTMKNCANFTLQLYVKMCIEGCENNFHSSLYAEFEEFSNHLKKLLPILEFVTSKEASSIILAITYICLEELNKGNAVNPPQVVIINADEQPTPLYDFWFWTKECDINEVFTGAKARVDATVSY